MRISTPTLSAIWLTSASNSSRKPMMDYRQEMRKVSGLLPTLRWRSCPPFLQTSATHCSSVKPLQCTINPGLPSSSLTWEESACLPQAHNRIANRKIFFIVFLNSHACKHSKLGFRLLGLVQRKDRILCIFYSRSRLYHLSFYLRLVGILQELCSSTQMVQWLSIRWLQ
jgi:hypothetical protein